MKQFLEDALWCFAWPYFVAVVAFLGVKDYINSKRELFQRGDDAEGR